jgi:hypothetical protein
MPQVRVDYTIVVSVAPDKKGAYPYPAEVASAIMAGERWANDMNPASDDEWRIESARPEGAAKAVMVYGERSRQ